MYRLPVFATAFRIFFFACTLHALAIISLWILQLRGISILPQNISPVYWHTYEMVFGFCRAAIFGFLFTAGQNWAGKQLTGSKALVVLFLLWFTGRLAFFLPQPLAHAAFAADIAANLFALYRLRPLLDPKQKNNHRVVYLFAIYALAHALAVICNGVASLQVWFMDSVRLGLLTVAFLVAIIAGRVLPFFAGVVMQKGKPRIFGKLESILWPLMFITCVSYAARPLHSAVAKICAGLFLLNAVLHLIRWVFWKPFASAKMPILAILYLGYFWLIAGFFLLALSEAGLLANSPAWHMLGVGGAGVFIFGMATRVALGHTGRPIKASGFIVLAYLLLNTALISRVLLPFTGRADLAYLIAAVAWIAAFASYLIQYTRLLFTPRIDGRPG